MMDPAQKMAQVSEEVQQQPAPEEDEERSIFLRRLRDLPFKPFYYQKENFEMEDSDLEPEDVLMPKAAADEGYGRPIAGMDLDDVKHYSNSALKEMTENFSEEYVTAKTKFGRLFRARMQQDSEVQEVAIKTWDFFYPPKTTYKGHPTRLHDEILLLMKEEMKSNKNLVKLIGFCCETKLAVLYDLKFVKTVKDVLEDDNFTFGARMKVAIQMGDLLKWFHNKLIVLGDIDIGTIMIDEEFNIKLFDFGTHACIPDKISEVSIDFNVPVYADYSCSPEAATHKASIKSDIKAYGTLLAELMTKKRSHCYSNDYLWLYCKEDLKNGRLSMVHNSIRCKPLIGRRLSKLAMACLATEPGSRPDMENVMHNLKEMVSELERDAMWRDEVAILQEIK